MHDTKLIVLETNIDDMNPQIYDYVIEQGFKLGAKDIWLENIQMKKNRPGIKLSVLTEPSMEKIFLNFIFKETTSIGIRVYPVTRYALKREIAAENTQYGPINFKLVYTDEGQIKKHPEYEDCKRIAKERDIPLRDIFIAFP